MVVIEAWRVILWNNATTPYIWTLIEMSKNVFARNNVNTFNIKLIHHEFNKAMS